MKFHQYINLSNSCAVGSRRLFVANQRVNRLQGSWNCSSVIGRNKSFRLNDAQGRLFDIQLFLTYDFTRAVVHSLHKHTEHIQNLKPHPIYPTIFCSSGCDGLLLLWDAESGRKLSEVYFPSTVETNEPISLHDVRWSPDGTQISACDSQGLFY